MKILIPYIFISSTIASQSFKTLPSISSRTNLLNCKISKRFLRKTKMNFSSANSISELRKEYSKQGILESDPIVASGPFSMFSTWLKEACEAKVTEPNAMCLSTVQNNMPSARMVLLKSFDSNGFVWYTNYNSRKSGELLQNPNACLTFWWGDLERSVRIEGRVEKVSDEESDKYFNSRPRGSQIGAWSSQQSSPIDSRSSLELQEHDVLDRFKDVENIPRPPHWGGWRLTPNRIEFWKGRESRLHDRLVFERSSSSDEWTFQRLQP